MASAAIDPHLKVKQEFAGRNECGARVKSLSLPPRVADARKWVPYFLMRFSLICCKVGRRPSNRRLRRNSGAKGNAAFGKSLFSVARPLTFQWLNSLTREMRQKVRPESSRLPFPRDSGYRRPKRRQTKCTLVGSCAITPHSGRLANKCRCNQYRPEV